MKSFYVVTFVLCVLYFISTAFAAEFRLSNPQQCVGWGKTAAMIQLTKQKGMDMNDVLKEYLAETKREPREKMEVEAVVHLIKHIYSDGDSTVHYMDIYKSYYEGCIRNQGLVYSNKDI